MNQRKHIRSMLSAEVRITANKSQAINATLVDLSTNGMLVQAETALNLGQECQIQLLLGDSKHKLPIHAHGKVIRANDQHFAIQFSSVGLGENEVLEQSILTHADDPDACVKEFALSAFIFDPLSVSNLEPYSTKSSFQHL
ncbi:MAG: PilZ domain-containing protein [Mariprofundus sp.]|nr:PilZ domain-containing protein [Mariprofundus sp.]